MSPEIPAEAVAAWCDEYLGSACAETLFAKGNLSRIHGLRLVDGREVVVKIRPAQPRLAGCAVVHRQLWRAGFPCPEPLAGPLPLAGDGALAVNAETLVRGGGPYPPGDGPDRAKAFARLLARFVEMAPAPGRLPDLAPPPRGRAFSDDEFRQT